MKTKILALCVLTICARNGFSQDTTKVDEAQKWKLESIYSLNGSQSSFVNWNAGGRNNISLLGTVNSFANYNFEKNKWENEISLALGGIKYVSKGSTEPLQKTDDKIDLTSTYGYKLKENLYASVLLNFKTQMLDGFNNPADSIRASGFLAPGYMNLALGLDYSPTKSLSIFLSPLALKLTIVNDQRLANSGAFGVKGAEYDGIGVLIKKGEMFREEIGAYMRIKFNKELMKNVSLKSKLELFSNYQNNPQNIDVNAESLFIFKINDWFSASLQWNLLYDDDIDIRDIDGNTGPRTQFKSVLGIGVSYKMNN